MFYTYIHLRKDNNAPFYVGKGKGKRFCSIHNRNRWWKNVVKKHDFHAEILAYWETEKEAFEHEKFLIECLKSIGHNLVNMTNGGDGTSGWIPSQEWRQKKSDSQKALFKDKKNNPMTSPENRKKKSQNLSGSKLSEETKKKISASLIGNTRSLGRNLSDNHKKKISDSLLGNKRTAGKKLSDEHKMKLSLALKGRKKSLETIQKQIAGRKATYERKRNQLS